MTQDVPYSPPPYLGIPPSAFWRAAYTQSGERLTRQVDDAAEEAFWREYAPGYDEKSPLAACASELIEDLCGLMGSDWHMVEVGAGPGAFTRRLAAHLSRITAVEPSVAMRAEFEKLWDGPDVVETLGCKWEDAPTLDADMVFAANALYRMRDISAALLKMDSTARHHVALVQTIGRPHANPLSVTRDGQTVERERADALCDVLSELGIDYNRRDYHVERPDGPSRAALIDWVPRKTG